MSSTNANLKVGVPVMEKKNTQGNSRHSSSIRKSINSENVFEDPISAYFKQRCGSTGKTSFCKTESGSSFGLLDVDNMSVFSENEENLRFSSASNFSEHHKVVSSGMSKSKKYSDVSKASLSDVYINIEKQRALAQKMLKKVNTRASEGHSQQSLLRKDKARESEVLSDISSQVNNKLSNDRVSEKWFQPNFTPNTPRYFNDELDSIDSENNEQYLTGNKLKTDAFQKDIEKKRESLYAEKLNSMLRDIDEFHINSDMEFKTQTKEEQINRFEEDERKFKLENSAVLHNSRISQFSGNAGGEISHWPSEPNLHKAEADAKNLSIGQFFTMRSNRISSLVGSVADGDNVVSNVQDLELPEPSDPNQTSVSNNNCTLPVTDSLSLDTLKARRCFSSYDLRQTPEHMKNDRFSSDSSSSNSTLKIQKILADMESGLSGTQIYENLVKSYGKNSNADKGIKNTEGKKIPLENTETPKSSKVSSKRNEQRQKGHSDSEAKVVKNAKKCTPPSKVDECTENNPVYLNASKLNQTVLSVRSDKIKKLKGKKGFDSSTPKVQNSKPYNDKLLPGKVIMDAEEWEVPRISSIQQTIELTKTEINDESDKTITVDSTITPSEINQKCSTITINDTVKIEDTLVAGDLTVLTQKIDEMKEESVCIVRSEEPVLFTVIEKLANLPKGTVDCSALAPLLRDQFPELLSNLSSSSDHSQSFHLSSRERTEDVMVSARGSWTKFPVDFGYNEKIYVCADIKISVSIPLINISENWLLVSIDSVIFRLPSGDPLAGTNIKKKWAVRGYFNVELKDTLIPPKTQKALQLLFVSQLTRKLDIMIDFHMKNVLTQKIQTRTLNLLVHCINPLDFINVIPKDVINFGTIADQCFDQRNVQISYDGASDLPVVVFIRETFCQSKYFILRQYVNGNLKESENNDGKFYHIFPGGEKQFLEFRVFFQPNALLDVDTTRSFQAKLIIKLDKPVETDGIVQKIPIKGTVGFAKFLCSSTCSPLVFRIFEPGVPITKSYPLKNVGSIPITFSVKIIDGETQKEVNDNLFLAPKSFYLSKNEESEISVTFSGKTTESCTKRLMVLQIQPNGRAVYDVELIGLVGRTEGKPSSRSSKVSGSTKSETNSESKYIKLLTTAQSLSWPALFLENEMRQTFQLKNVSDISATGRIFLKKSTDSFKLINDNGEKTDKVRKVFKPDCPVAVTVSFRPNCVGGHHNLIYIETNQSRRKKMIPLSGIGGHPKIFIQNIITDLNGHKMISLKNSSKSQLFSSTLQLRNDGRVSGFILIQPIMEVMSLSHELVITPSSCVLTPDSKITIHISQKFKSDTLEYLLSDRDITKIATLWMTMGAEPSRLRYRKLINNGKLEVRNRLKALIGKFQGETDVDLKIFDDPPIFEELFLKTIKTIEVAVVVERSSEVCEPTLLEDANETVESFVTIRSAMNNTVIEKINKKEKTTSPFHVGPSMCDTTVISIDTVAVQNKITKWLEGLDSQD